MFKLKYKIVEKGTQTTTLCNYCIIKQLTNPVLGSMLLIKLKPRSAVSHNYYIVNK